jgi:hypothetical protein
MHATEKSLRNPDLPAIAAAELAPGELPAVEEALAALKGVMESGDREAIEQKTAALNQATRHLAEVMMNASVKAALAGKRVDSV